MWIEPNSSIRLLKNVPLDNTYEHTIFFSSITNQTNYFVSKTKFNFARCTYQRNRRGYARVDRKADDLYDCNYMMFQNTSYGNKWFYAFVTNVEFINNQCAEVTFEIDVMQTWHFDYSFRRTFVEREHSVNDDIGENLLPEPVELGNYTINSAYSYELDELVPVICTAFGDNIDDPTGGGDETYVAKYNNVISGAKYYAIVTETNLTNISNYFKQLAKDNKLETVVSIYLVPKFFVNDDGSIPSDVKTRTLQTTFSETLDNYTPKNKKLFTYPYNFIEVSDNCGSTADYKYEYFNASSAKFNLYGTVLGEPSICVLPENYNGVIGDNADEAFIVSNFPQMAFTCDTYRAWVASGGRFENRMNAIQGVASGVTQALGGVSGMAKGGSYDAMGGYSPSESFGGFGVAGSMASVANGAINATTSVMSAYKTGKVMEAQGNVVKGSMNVMAMCCIGKKDIVMYNKCCRKEYLQYIDDYFSMYGYATKRLKTPNRDSRPHWNYVKTGSCTIDGSVPAEATRAICAIYNNGITFWKNAGEVGNYNLDNTPT